MALHAPIVFETVRSNPCRAARYLGISGRTDEIMYPLQVTLPERVEAASACCLALDRKLGSEEWIRDPIKAAFTSRRQPLFFWTMSINPQPELRAIMERERQTIIYQPGFALVLIGLLSDLGIATVKFAAAYSSGSSAMSSEGVHSLVDAGTELLLLYAIRASSHLPTANHQLGFGREVFFWNFIVAVLIFLLGAGAAFVNGLRQFAMPSPIENETLNFVVLACAALLEGVALWVAFRKLRLIPVHAGIFRYLSDNRDPTASTIIFGGIASIAGVAVTAVGLIATVASGDGRYDGLASLAVSAILALTAFKLAAQSKTLLIGVPAERALVSTIFREVMCAPSVKGVNGIVSAHLGPSQILIALSVWFDDELSKAGVEQAIERIEDQLRTAHPAIIAIFIKPQSPERYAKLRKDGTYSGVEFERFPAI